MARDGRNKKIATTSYTRHSSSARLASGSVRVIHPHKWGISLSDGFGGAESDSRRLPPHARVSPSFTLTGLAQKSRCAAFERPTATYSMSLSGTPTSLRRRPRSSAASIVAPSLLDTPQSQLRGKDQADAKLVKALDVLSSYGFASPIALMQKWLDSDKVAASRRLYFRHSDETALPFVTKLLDSLRTACKGTGHARKAQASVEAAILGAATGILQDEFRRARRANHFKNRRGEHLRPQVASSRLAQSMLSAHAQLPQLSGLLQALLPEREGKRRVNTRCPVAASRNPAPAGGSDHEEEEKETDGDPTDWEDDGDAADEQDENDADADAAEKLQDDAAPSQRAKMLYGNGTQVTEAADQASAIVGSSCRGSKVRTRLLVE